MAGETVADRLRERLPSLPGSQQRLARYILDNYPAALIAPAAETARHAMVSEASVSRLVVGLGYRSFRHLRHTVSLELQESPLLTFARSQPSATSVAADTTDGAASIAGDQLEVEVHLLNALRGSQTVRRIDQVARALCNARRKYIVGGQGSRYLAQHAAYLLSLPLPDVYGLGPGDAELIGHISSTNADDLWLVICLPRYDRRTVTLAAHLREHGVSVVSLTDSASSPIASGNGADLLVPFGPGRQWGWAPAIGVIDALAAECIVLAGSEAETRMAGMEGVFRSLGIFKSSRAPRPRPGSGP